MIYTRQETLMPFPILMPFLDFLKIPFFPHQNRMGQARPKYQGLFKSQYVQKEINQLHTACT